MFIKLQLWKRSTLRLWVIWWGEELVLTRQAYSEEGPISGDPEKQAKRMRCVTPREARTASPVAGGNQEGREWVWPGVDSELAECEVVDLYPENNKTQKVFQQRYNSDWKGLRLHSGEYVTGRLEQTERDREEAILSTRMMGISSKVVL